MTVAVGSRNSSSCVQQLEIKLMHESTSISFKYFKYVFIAYIIISLKIRHFVNKNFAVI
jgi:hypothetical protein